MKKTLTGLFILVLIVSIAVITVIAAENARQIMSEESFMRNLSEILETGDWVRLTSSSSSSQESILIYQLSSRNS